MPSATSPELPSPWREFLLEVDRSLSEAIMLHCLGGFVATIRYGLARTTADIDYVEIVPFDTLRVLQRLADPGSPLAQKYGLYFQHVTVASPLDVGVLRTRYERELRPITIGNLERLDATLEMWIQAYFE